MEGFPWDQYMCALGAGALSTVVRAQRRALCARSDRRMPLLPHACPIPAGPHPHQACPPPQQLPACHGGAPKARAGAGAARQRLRVCAVRHRRACPSGNAAALGTSRGAPCAHGSWQPFALASPRAGALHPDCAPRPFPPACVGTTGARAWTSCGRTRRCPTCRAYWHATASPRTRSQRACRTPQPPRHPGSTSERCSSDQWHSSSRNNCMRRDTPIHLFPRLQHSCQCLHRALPAPKHTPTCYATPAVLVNRAGIQWVVCYRGVLIAQPARCAAGSAPGVLPHFLRSCTSTPLPPAMMHTST